MNAPKISTLAIVSGASAATIAAAVAVLVNIFGALPARVVQPPAPSAIETMARLPDGTEKLAQAKQLGLEPGEITARDKQQMREYGELRDKMDRRARNRSIAMPHWEQELGKATDLKKFMDELLPVAEGGDTSAQFTAYLALAQCRHTLRERPPVAERLGRCLALSRTRKQFEDDAAYWLDRSATGNYPRAIAQRAMLRLGADAVSRLT